MAGASMMKNEVVNIEDCYEDPRFDRSVDKKTGFRTRQMLCVPIQNSANEVIGAIQIINTNHGRPFSDMDVELLQGFRGYVQISIMNRAARESGRAEALESRYDFKRTSFGEAPPPRSST